MKRIILLFLLFSACHIMAQRRFNGVNNLYYRDTTFYENGYTEYNYVSSRMLLEHYKECNWNTQYNSDKNKYIQLVLTTTYNDTKEEILQGQCDSSEQ